MKKKSTAIAWVVIMLLGNAIGTLAYSQSIAVLGSDHCAESSISSHVRRIRELLSTKGGNVKTEAEMIAKLGGAATISMADVDRALVASRDDLLSMAYARATLPLELVIKELYLLPPSQKDAKVYVTLIPSSLGPIADRARKKNASPRLVK